jgi:hypothetical protein
MLTLRMYSSLIVIVKDKQYQFKLISILSLGFKVVQFFINSVSPSPYPAAETRVFSKISSLKGDELLRNIYIYLSGFSICNYFQSTASQGIHSVCTRTLLLNLS